MEASLAVRVQSVAAINAPLILIRMSDSSIDARTFGLIGAGLVAAFSAYKMFSLQTQLAEQNAKLA